MELLNELSETSRKINIPSIPSIIEAYRSRIRALQGNAEAAALYIENNPPVLNLQTSFVEELEAIIKLDILLALNKPDAVLEFSAALLAGARVGQRWSRVIEILAIQALALQSKGPTAQSLKVLGEALVLAEPEGYMRTFLDKGQPMLKLLQRAVGEGISMGYSPKLLAAFELQKKTISSPSPGNPPQPGLIDPLSEREIEVLRLLAGGMTNQEIADKLIISLNTIKTHVKNIHTKLGVRNRLEASVRAHNLGLI